MHLPCEQDTPIIRASILELTEEELHARLDQLRERRLKAYTIYQAGIELKARAAADKALAGLDKKLEQLKKQFEAVDKALDKLEKLTLDVQALRLIAGDSIV